METEAARVRALVWGDDEAIGERAIARAAELPEPDAKRILRDALADVDLDVAIRWSALLELRDLGDFEPIAGALADPRQDCTVRSESICALVTVRDDRWDAYLRAALVDDSPEIRRAGLRAVGRANRRDLVDAVAAVADQDTKRLIRWRAKRVARSLARVDGG